MAGSNTNPSGSGHQNSFFLYDLETSGVDPRSARIMQFAGQRTDMQLNPIGEPYNVLIKLTEDVLPEPDAIMITGITPQQTLADGISEAEFVRIFLNEVATPHTIFAGFNNIRFDDEFMRFTLYRNFCDAYEWHWKDGRSRFDLLDVARMTRALRPEGIQWPYGSDGKPTNRLELLSKLNKLEHNAAHDALSDVQATIAVAKLIRHKQPKLFDYLLGMRDKSKVAELIARPQPFVYASGKYAAEYEKVALAYSLGERPDKQGVLVYDLRYDPSQFFDMPPHELADLWRYSKDVKALRLPVKTLRPNRCPAVAPVGVLTDENKQRLQLDLDRALQYKKLLASNNAFTAKLHEALAIFNTERAKQTSLIGDERAADTLLYEGFLRDNDKRTAQKLVTAEPETISSFAEQFDDVRLKTLVPLYKARNYPAVLSDDERAKWEAFRDDSLQKRMPLFAKRLQALASSEKLSAKRQYILEELKLYAESIIPEL